MHAIGIEYVWTQNEHFDTCIKAWQSLTRPEVNERKPNPNDLESNWFETSIIFCCNIKFYDISDIFLTKPETKPEPGPFTRIATNVQ